MIEYITLSDLVKKVSQDAVEKGKEIFNTKKIREKYINIFEMMNIDRDKLKASDCKQSKDFKIPKDSQNFLINVYWLYSDADMKKMRKGLFEQASLESIAELLDGFREMILKLDISENDKDEMISKMYLRTKYPYLQRRAEVLKELENIKLDFCPDYQDDARVEDELQNYVDNNDIKNMMEMDNISAQRRFRYYDILDNLDVNDQLLFTSFVLEDIRCMIKRHHELYSYISEIRTCEINDAAEQKALNMTSEEEEHATELNRKIEDLTEYYNYLRKVRQEKSDYINKKIVDCSELISNIRGCGILGMLCNVRDSYNKLSEIDDAYTEQLEIIKENINYYQDEVRKEKNEILQLEYKIENCYREIEESKG